MNAVVGVVMDGIEGSSALCADHWSALKKLADGRLTTFLIRKNRTACGVCREIRKVTREAVKR